MEIRLADQDTRSLDQALAWVVRQLVDRFGDDWLLLEELGCPGHRQVAASAVERQAAEPIQEPEAHPFFEIFICLTGCCAMRLGAAVLAVRAGDVAVIPPGQVHHEQPLRQADYLGIWVTTDRERCLLHLSGKQEAKGFFTVSGQLLQPAYFNLMFSHIAQELQLQDQHRIDAVKSYLLQLLIHACREVSRTQPSDNQGSLWAENRTIEVIRYIEHHDDRPIRLQDISHAVNISGNYLNTMFRSVTGKTIPQYIAEHKLGKARSILLNSHETIQAIATRLGYYDPYHFSKAFKKAYGLSPSRYRRLRDQRPAE